MPARLGCRPALVETEEACGTGCNYATMMFKRMDHIGVIVADLEDAERWLADVFGLPFRRRSDSPERGVRTAFYRCGEVDIEVIEVTDPEARRQRLGEGERARIEHIAVEVTDLQAVLARLAALGVRTNEPEPRRIGDNLNVWTIAGTSGGVSYQLIQRGPTPSGAGGSSD